MVRNKLSALVLSALALCGAQNAAAQMMMDGHTDHHMDGHATSGQTSDGMHGHGSMHGHGPIGVMGRHLMPPGKFMLGYRFGHMQMSGLRFGTSDISADAATSIPNIFAGMPGQPATLRVIPDEMTMNMHMITAMYGASERVTLMAMLPYIEKEMTAITYSGPSGTTVLGRSTRSSEGLGDIRVGAIIDVSKGARSSLNATVGLSLPTGSITETGQMLTPMGTRPVRRLGYNMQLGSGTFDLLPALTYQTAHGKTSFGAQLSGIVRLGSNDEGYSLGDETALTAWASYQAAPWISLSGRIEARQVGRIDGRDPNIMGPAPGANPNFIGGDIVSVFAGVDLSLRTGAFKGHRIGLELGVPVYQDLNGPMLKREWQIALAWRTSF